MPMMCRVQGSCSRYMHVCTPPVPGSHARRTPASSTAQSATAPTAAVHARQRTGASTSQNASRLLRTHPPDEGHLLAHLKDVRIHGIRS